MTSPGIHFDGSLRWPAVSLGGCGGGHSGGYGGGDYNYSGRHYRYESYDRSYYGGHSGDRYESHNGGGLLGMSLGTKPLQAIAGGLHPPGVKTSHGNCTHHN
jgi:hypothetical protein